MADTHTAETFGEMLDYLMKHPEARGTGGPRGILTTSVLSNMLGVSNRSVRNWIQNRAYPSGIDELVTALFGNAANRSPEARPALGELFDLYRGPRAIRERPSVFYSGEAKVGSTKNQNWSAIEKNNLQTYTVVTPLTREFCLVSLSITTVEIHNSLQELQSLVNVKGDYRFERARDSENLFQHLCSDRMVQRPQDTELMEALYDALDNRYAVLSRGSIKPVKSSDIDLSPATLKAYSKLKSNEFRVGLYRAGLSIIVLRIAQKPHYIFAAPALKVLWDVGSYAVSKLHLP